MQLAHFNKTCKVFILAGGPDKPRWHSNGGGVNLQLKDNVTAFKEQVS